MKFLKAISTAALALTLVACSSAPSDADVQAVTQQSLQQADQQLAPLGLRWSDVFDTQVKVKNKAKQEDGRLAHRGRNHRHSQERPQRTSGNRSRCWCLHLRVT